MHGKIPSLLVVGAFLLATPASADTLREALARAYQTNPTITGARAGQRAVDENVPIARAAGLPSASAGGSYSENLLRSGNSLSSPARSASADTSLVVPIYRGGAVRNSLRAAETRADAGRLGLRGTESDLFTDVVAAYNDVIRDEAVVGLNHQNVRVLEINLRASRDRFQVGDLTRTDVAQSEARLSIARGQLQSAEARLISSRENYIRVVGAPPGTLAEPPPLPNLPVSVDAAVAQALADNPFLLAAARQRDATRYDIGIARAARLPQVSGVVGGSYTNFLGSLGSGTGVRVGQDGASGNVGLSLSLPLFQGGRPGAQVRQAEARRSQAIEAVTETERAVIAQARSAFAVYRSSLEVIASSQNAVNANRLSLEGVRAENSVGTRTILDILNAEQELLNSQVTLVTARRDAYVAGFALLAAMGNAEARDLGLDGGALYDPMLNYNRVRRRINDFASDGEPAPVATGTTLTPSQDAAVTRPLEPALGTPVDRTRSLSTGSASPNRQ
ncbi:MAG: rane protein [Sphingomonas bacterium]|uniref:TolC family outer membrane protein n=1 Tax=Sphingomonas bacterium TaxID=1895847 RepID=UPI002619248D|nr:TolC family outer membrane protein [Sphingomonas bacterium]MDB5696695.1 rane protein [Sphingomonas bacterium]